MRHSPRPTLNPLFQLSLLLAMPAMACASSFDGFYVGVSGGGTQMQADIDANQIVHFANSSSPDHFFYVRELTPYNELDTYDTSWMLALRAGYGKSFSTNPFYLGFELFSNVADREAESSVESQYNAPNFYFIDHNKKETDINIKLNDVEFGADIRPGIFITPTTLFYARVGAAINKLALSVSNDLALSFTLPETAATNFITQSKSDDVAGLRLGLGLENAITSSLSITADYIYTDYGSVKVNGAFDTVNPDKTIGEDQFISDISADMTAQTVLLGLNYYPNANEKNMQTMVIHPNMIKRFNGFYGGARGGLLVNNAALDDFIGIAFFFEDSEVPVADTVTESAHLWNNRAIGEIFFGYGHLIEKFGESLYYVGVELFGNLGDRELKTTLTEDFSDTNILASDVPYAVIKSSTETRINLNPFEWGADAKLGRLFSNNTLIFARIGFAINEIEATKNGLFTFSDFNLDFESAAAFYAEESKDVTGLRLGLGLEQMLWHNLAVTADYIYTDYGSIDINGVADTIGDDADGSPLVNPNGFVSETNFDMRTHAVMLGLTYHL